MGTLADIARRGRVGVGIRMGCKGEKEGVMRRQRERESESVCGLNGGGGPKFTAGASARVVMFVSSG